MKSFVFHDEYISDLPEDYREKFTLYTVNYGLYGKKPPIKENTLEYSLWVKILRRIDAEREKYERIKAKRALAGKAHSGNQYQQKQNKEEAVTTAEVQKKTVKRFEKPTVEEIEAYCEEKNYRNVNAEKFLNYYESNGWKVGKNPMKSWKAAVSNWESNNFAASPPKSTGMWDKESDVSEDYIGLI